ncbi:hypothetical protein AS026_02790 [Rhizobium altiplani]|uniref:ABC transporter domain-containing protein n=1 Tax=Rhizobium altiplani TaxID=1864509 RepID=A0A109JRR2_9HYPH|nr:hypothetical protein AS026_02790 [Rhizobium altiplani]
MRDPKVVVLDEPTRGIDVGAREGIDDIIADLAKQSVAVIVVSSDLEEVLGVSNRILVLAQGKQAGILNRDEANDVFELSAQDSSFTAAHVHFMFCFSIARWT